MKKIILSLFALLGINIGVKSQIDKLDVGLTKTLELAVGRFEKTNNTSKKIFLDVLFKFYLKIDNGAN